MNIVSIEKQIVARQYASSGYVQWRIVVTTEFAGGPEMRAEVEVTPEGASLVDFDANDSEARVEEADDAMVIVRRYGYSSEEAVVIPLSVWNEKRDDVKNAAWDIIQDLEQEERHVIRRLIGQEVGA